MPADHLSQKHAANDAKQLQADKSFFEQLLTQEPISAPVQN